MSFGLPRLRAAFNEPAIPGKEPRMLVLSRQRDQSIIIGDDIEITIVDVRGEKVRLGISAPSHVPVHRKEVYEAIKREQEAANGDTYVKSLAKEKKDRPKDD
jgi:carbon storage regulator